MPSAAGYIILISLAMRRSARQAPVTEREVRSRLRGQEDAMSRAPEPFASRYRRSAATCGVFVACAVSRSDREFLLRMQRRWLELKRCEELGDFEAA